MNGRALSEKAIEVSPSSSRVLDRAAEILTPFPPSKNRPRPGDWTCPSCGFSNFQRRTACFRCSFPAMSSGPTGAPMGYQYGYGSTGMVPHHHHHHHHSGHGHGMGHMRGGHSSSNVPFRAGDWKCGSEGCGYHNFAKNVSCLRCGASRASAALVADSAFSSPMDNSASYAMGPPPMGGGAPGSHGAFGSPASFGSGVGFAGQQYSGPPYIPSGLGAASPYAPMAAQFAPNGAMHSSGFENRPTDMNYPPTGQLTSSANMGFANGSFDGGADPFSFLSTGLGGLSMADDNRRDIPPSTNKSPA